MLRSKTNRSLVVLYATIALDAAGIGLIFPILPRLVAEIAGDQQVAFIIGIIAALYAVMQFVFSPILGALSDQFGRRPVMLISLAGAAIDYFVMACAPRLWLIVLGRAIAGLTSANMAVADAYLTDITPEDQRARRFGLISAMFGAGFVVGPVLGGLLGDHGIRLPFLCAAALNAANFVLALLLLPESRTSGQAKFHLAVLNPFRPLGWLRARKGLLPVVLVYFALSAGGEAYAVCWALWGFDAFRWNGLWIGLSLGAFGICQTLTQAVLPGPATKLLGERAAVITGIVCTCVALVVLAFAGQGWIVFAAMPVFALAGIGTPAFQALATRQVDADNQGQLQGVLAAAVSLASIVAPLVFSIIYGGVRQQWPGAIWLAVAAINVLALPLVFLSTRQPQGRIA